MHQGNNNNNRPMNFYNHYVNDNYNTNTNQYTDVQRSNAKQEHQALVEKYSVIDPQLEILDPNPDLGLLYRQCDRLYFGGFLSQTAVQVGWVQNLADAAGIYCNSYYSVAQGRPTILLSANLLGCRSRRDILETLLHEMIHAYIDQAGIQDSDHGPHFCYHLLRINTEAGTSIGIYHNYCQELDHHLRR